MRIIDNILGFGGHGYLDPSYVVIHETAGPGAPARNIVSWWENGGGLPVHYCGDWSGDCYYCVPEDEVCWQVGNGNQYVVGIELCHATNQEDFNAVWDLGVEWAAWQLSKRGWGTDRLLSHYQCGQIWGGTDHTDPIGYFEEFGRSWDEFVADVAAYMSGEYKKVNDLKFVNNEGGDVYRLYNKNTGMHFFTIDKGEKDALVEVGWKYEGIAFTAPKGGVHAVYRMYNPGNGDHLLTTNYSEAENLQDSGWVYEGVPFFAQPGGTGKPVYRVYNPNSGEHFLTASEGEANSLVKEGWEYEGGFTV